MPTVRLEATGLTSLPLDPYNGFIVQAIDLGDAETRVVSEPAPDADGTIDTTTLIGARSVTLNVKLRPGVGQTKEQMRRMLRAFTAPRLTNLYMYFSLDGLAEQRILLRRSQFSNVIQNPAYANCVVQWVAPLGIIESSLLHSQLVYASGATPPGGRTYPLTYPRSYPAATPVGTATVHNDGTAPAYPLLRLYGPCTDPVIDNLTQGYSLVFTSLTVAASDFVEVDTRARTIYLNGDPTASLYNKLSYPTSHWWTLSPGDNTIKYHPATFTDATTVAEVNWRDAFL